MGDAFRAGLLGYPLVHSRSAEVYEALFARINERVEYRLSPGLDEVEIKGWLQDPSVDGWNITLPHKERVISWVDEVDVSASVCGAANVLFRKNGAWCAANSDGIAFLRVLSHHGIDPKQHRWLILGSGGAARTAWRMLQQTGATVNHTSRLESFLRRSAGWDDDFKSSWKEIGAVKGQWDVLVDATSALTLGTTDDFLQWIAGGLLPVQKNKRFLSMNYHAPARVHEFFREKSCIPLATFGMEMLVLQAIENMRFWGKPTHGLNLTSIAAA